VPKLQYDFSVIGLPAVHAALASLEKRLAQHNAKVNRIVGGGAGGGKGKRPPIPVRGDKKQQKGLTRLDRTAKRMHGKRMSELGALEQQQIKTAHKVHKIKRKNQVRRARANKREKIRAVKEIGRIENQAQLKRTREASKAARTHQRTVERTRANRLATGRKVVGGGVRGVGRSLRGVGRAGLMYGGMAAGAAGGAALSYEMNIDERVRLLAMATHSAQESRIAAKTVKKGEQYLELPARGASIKSIAQGTSQRTGVSTEKVLQGLQKWQEITGRGDLADKIAPMIGDFSQVFGADPKAVAGTAAFIFDRIRKEQNADGSDISTNDALKKTMNVMNSAGAQGQLGMIEFNTLAPVMSKLVSATMNVKGPIEDVIKQFIALAQLSVSGGARDAFEATTALMRFTDNIKIIAKKKSFKDMNARLAARGQPLVDPYTYSEPDKYGVVRHGVTDPIRVLKELYRGTGGDIVEMQGMLSIRGKKVAEPIMDLIKKYSGGKLDKDSMALGFKGMEKHFKMFTDAQTNEEAWEALKKYAQSSSKAVATRAWEQIASKLGPEVVKVLEALVPVAGDIGDAFVIVAKGLAGFIKAMHDSPWSTLGAILGAILVKEIAAAGIGHMVGVAISTSVGSAGLSASVAAAMGTALIAAAATAAVLVAAHNIEQLRKEAEVARQDAKDNRENELQLAERRGQTGIGRKKQGDFWTRILRGDSIEDASYGGEYIKRGKSGKIITENVGDKSLWGSALEGLMGMTGTLAAHRSLTGPKGPEKPGEYFEYGKGSAVATAEPISALHSLDSGDLEGAIADNTIAVGDLAGKVANANLNRGNTPGTDKDY